MENIFDILCILFNFTSISLSRNIFRKYCEINSYNKELIVNCNWGSEESGSIDCSFQHKSSRKMPHQPLQELCAEMQK